MECCDGARVGALFALCGGENVVARDSSESEVYGESRLSDCRNRRISSADLLSRLSSFAPSPLVEAVSCMVNEEQLRSSS